MAGGGLDHADSVHADLNLALRGYAPVNVELGLQHKNGPVDVDAPQLAAIFADRRAPAFVGAFQINDWNWQCGGDGCQGAPLSEPAATLLALQGGVGEALSIPGRNAQIYDGDYKALVLYAAPTRITVGYTREDTVANGYVVHLENICVDPALVALYQASNAAGRGALPALRQDETLGTMAQDALLIAVRDRGTFTDPRSRLDWWHGY
ncbi:MAG: hypothetical protein IPK16_19790 [Anaerolineales bacterium]|nr:hypothetical protein [Anaerolineales bacterium]